MVAWVLNLWNYVPSDVVRKFIAASKSAVDYRDWANSKHDVCGELVQSR